MSNNIEFKLSDVQMEDLRIWREKITDLHGRVGSETFTFSIAGGLGYTCHVKNETFNIEIDISHEEEW